MGLNSVFQIFFRATLCLLVTNKFNNTMPLYYLRKTLVIVIIFNQVNIKLYLLQNNGGNKKCMHKKVLKKTNQPAESS